MKPIGDIKLHYQLLKEAFAGIITFTGEGYIPIKGMYNTNTYTNTHEQRSISILLPLDEQVRILTDIQKFIEECVVDENPDDTLNKSNALPEYSYYNDNITIIINYVDNMFKIYIQSYISFCSEVPEDEFSDIIYGYDKLLSDEMKELMLTD